MSTDYSVIENDLLSAVGPVRLIAVSYLSTPPAGVEKFAGTVPSGCTFWRLAAAGKDFYTVPGDHLNCAIGSYTHSIDEPAERAGELERTLELMTGVGYVRMAEVPSIPRLPVTPAFTYYAPLGKAVVEPDVVIASGRPAALMRMQEAAARAGASSTLPLLGRPTCMGLPAAMVHGTVLSTGCIGNRVYTNLGDDELYLMIPGARLADVVRELDVIAKANDTLRAYHEERKVALTSQLAASTPPSDHPGSSKATALPAQLMPRRDGRLPLRASSCGDSATNRSRE